MSFIHFVNGIAFDYFMKTNDMKKPQNNSQQTFTFNGILLTSSILLAAFTYSEKEQIKNDLNKTEPIKMDYTIEKTIKPKEQKPIIAPKKKTNQITTSLKKDVTSTTKLIKNKTKSVNSNVIIKGLDINFDPDPNYKIIDIIPEIIDFPDIEAKFIGGYTEMNKYITHNLNLNQVRNLTREDEILVYVEFIVGDQGKIIDVKLKDPIDFELKIQIQKLMYEMPKWAPAELNGRKVSSRIFLPIRIHFQ